MKSTIDEWVDRFAPEESPEIKLPSYAGPVDRAQAEIAAGKYRAALSTLSSIKPDAKSEDAAARAILRARALLGLGEFEDAAILLASEPLASDPEAINVRVRDLLDREQGRLAAPIIDQWLAQVPDSIQAHLAHGQVLEQAGDFAAAIESYKWFLGGQQVFVQKWLDDPLQFENADDLSDIATAVHRWATLSMAYKEQASLNDTVLGMYVRAFDVIDREHIPSRVAAAIFAASRGNVASAQTYLKPALERAPHDPRVLLAAMRVGAQSEQEDAQSPVQALRMADPESFEAGLYEAIALANARQWPQADDRAGVLLQKYPGRPEAIALYAATQFVRQGPPRCDELLSQANTQWPARTDAHAFAARLLKGADQYDAAERYFKIVIERTPWQTEARHQLGGMFLNIGREDEARAVLDEAYKSDPYNLATVNFLRLLDDIAKYEKHHTEHVIVYFDPRLDPIVGEQVGAFMEQTFQDLVKIFDYTPDGKVIIQVYPGDDEFSVRMAGVPGVENFGVSFGRVLATISPRRGTKKGNFNWGRVLRHELVHTFNLMQTHHRVPRWLTEGLAVWQEGVPFRFKDVPEELYSRAMDGSLFTIRSFPAAFTRPTRPGDGEQAYTQGAWLARYLDETYGRASIVRLLGAYAAGKNDVAAFHDATGQTLEKIDADWHIWMKQQIAPWGYSEEATERAEALVNEGDQALKAKVLEQAVKSFAEAYALQPTELKPHQRLAYLYLQKETSNPVGAIEHLKFLHIFELQNNRFAKQIARIYMRQNDLENALKWAREATYVDLYDATSYDLIAEVAERMGRTEDVQRAKHTAARIALWDSQRGETQRTAEPPPANAPRPE
ncbi:MAG: hypothetical protein H7144_06840 [Burkholderiales bacterium]|nr:hypothetical protein [Phycisphaerae bacterium]